MSLDFVLTLLCTINVNGNARASCEVPRPMAFAAVLEVVIRQACLGLHDVGPSGPGAVVEGQ